MRDERPETRDQICGLFNRRLADTLTSLSTLHSPQKKLPCFRTAANVIKILIIKFSHKSDARKGDGEGQAGEHDAHHAGIAGDARGRVIADGESPSCDLAAAVNGNGIILGG